MFYDNSEPDFPNWWDALGEDGSGNEPDDGADNGGEGGAEGMSSFEDDLNRAARYGIPWEKDPGGSGGSDSVEEDSLPYAVRGSRDSYDREVVLRVWEYAEIVPGNDADLWRKDEFGNWIHRLDYGRRESEFGWEIFDPGVGRHAQGVYAMRPMQWESFLRRHETLG